MLALFFSCSTWSASLFFSTVRVFRFRFSYSVRERSYSMLRYRILFVFSHSDSLRYCSYCYFYSCPIIFCFYITRILLCSSVLLVELRLLRLSAIYYSSFSILAFLRSISLTSAFYFSLWVRLIFNILLLSSSSSRLARTTLDSSTDMAD